MAEFAVFGGGSGFGANPGNVGPNTYETITIRFYDQVEALTVATNPQIRVQRDGNVVTTIQSLNTPVSGQAGYFQLSLVATTEYQFTFSTHNLEAGLYDFVATGVIPNGHTATLQGQFSIAYISRTKMFIERLRKHLFDIDPKLYLLDEPRLIFPDDLLLEYLNTAVSEINSVPPASTRFNLENSARFDIDALILKGAKVYALRSRSILEAFNKLSYSDAQSLNIDRMPQLSQLAEYEYKDWQGQINKWKQWFAIYGSGQGSAVGMGTTTIPLQVSRALSLLPNLSQTFSL